MNIEVKQNKTPLIKLLVVLLIIGVLLSGAVALVPQVVQAQDETPQPPDVGLPGFGWPHDFDRMGKPGFGDNQIYETFLAQALGVTVEELQAARVKADQRMLEQAVADGRLTADQAALIQARQALMLYLDRETLTAKALGITVEELQAAREAGKSMETLLDELNLDADAVREAMETAYKEAVQQAVEDGVISQDQADQILSTNPGFGGHRPGFGGRGGFPGAPKMPGPNAVPTQEGSQ